MKTRREYLWFETANRMEFINITGQVQQIIDKLLEDILELGVGLDIWFSVRVESH